MSENKVVIACAGSGKTTKLVKDALAYPDRRFAIVTYTNDNAREIVKKFGELNSGVPKHVDVMTWYTFLLRECARPYQRCKYSPAAISSVCFTEQRSVPFIFESNTKNHYFTTDNRIYSDKISKFIVECEAKSSGAVIARLQSIYTDIFIDEFQDLAGWDFDLVEILLKSSIRLLLVGDAMKQRPELFAHIPKEEEPKKPTKTPRKA